MTDINWYHNWTDQPVIIVIDNDKGSKDIFSNIKKMTSATQVIDGSERFYKVCDGLFVVPLPKKDTQIENLFDQTVLDEKLGPRRFNYNQKTKEKLASDEYGKGDFARKVILPKRGDINYDNFKPLLDTISDIIIKKT